MRSCHNPHRLTGPRLDLTALRERWVLLCQHLVWWALTIGPPSLAVCTSAAAVVQEWAAVDFLRGAQG
jgi:hypothetical protein